MGRRVLRRHIWGYTVCPCPTKGSPGLNELLARATTVEYTCKCHSIFTYSAAQFLDILCGKCFLKISNYNLQCRLNGRWNKKPFFLLMRFAIAKTRTQISCAVVKGVAHHNNIFSYIYKKKSFNFVVILYS